ncbi:MAG TPA: FeoB-associated Cys-rich membrane protein [Candidatus Coprocola pullicola]|nr:FeoB-associated Cys-rich membrane protein [Candidatus Coprocola pullicola]
MGNIVVMAVLFCLLACAIYYQRKKKKRKQQGCVKSCSHCPFYKDCSKKEIP